MIMVMRRSRYYFQPEKGVGGGGNEEPFFGGEGGVRSISNTLFSNFDM